MSTKAKKSTNIVKRKAKMIFSARRLKRNRKASLKSHVGKR